MIIAGDPHTPEVVLHEHLLPLEGVTVVAAFHGELQREAAVVAALHLDMTAAGF